MYTEFSQQGNNFLNHQATAAVMISMSQLTMKRVIMTGTLTLMITTTRGLQVS
jgi:hypothetical protein